MKSILLSVVTATYFIPEILEMKPSMEIMVKAYGIQVIHDGFCIFFFLLCLKSLRYPQSKYLLEMNILHCIVMALFCYYKRCILTLWYNAILGIYPCHRYIPLWQRTTNMMIPKTCPEQWQSTYLWLNNHILQTGLVGFVNLFTWLRFHSCWKHFD